jgi:hypothetical protein
MARTEAELEGVRYKGFTIPAYRDVYGRRVLYFRERFPCFDVYDRMHENRYYHWYVILHDGGVALVYTEDEKPGVKVHEDYRPEEKTGFYFPEWIRRELEAAGALPGKA